MLFILQGQVIDSTKIISITTPHEYERWNGDGVYGFIVTLLENKTVEAYAASHKVSHINAAFQQCVDYWNSDKNKIPEIKVEF